MIRARWTGLAIAILVVLATVVSSGAGYVVDTPREATVVAAPDATATLSFVEEGDIDSGRERAAPIVTLTNRFPVTLTDVTVTVRDPTPQAPRLVSYTAPESLQPGESAAVLVDVICASGVSEDWPVTVTATGQGVSVELSRSVTVSCVFKGPGGGPGPRSTTESQLENTTAEPTEETSTDTTASEEPPTDDSPTGDSSPVTADDSSSDTAEGDEMADGGSTDSPSSEPIEGEESTTEHLVGEAGS